MFHQRYADHPAPGDRGVMVLGVGGGASVLAADACDRAGLAARRRSAAALVERLRAMGYGAGTSVVNPFEVPMGPAAPADTFNRLLDLVLAGAAVRGRAAPRQRRGRTTATAPAGSASCVETLQLLRRRRHPPGRRRVVLVARNVEVATPEAADGLRDAAIATGIPLYRTFDEAATAIAAGKRHARAARPSAARMGAE